MYLTINILISALLFSNSVPGKALKLALARSAVILISAETIEELAEVISRRKFDARSFLSVLDGNE